LDASSFGLAFQLSMNKMTTGQLFCEGGDAAYATC